MHIKKKPLLTIAIPTWNRSKYIEQNLNQLKNELNKIPEGLVEIVVSDNCSTDDTEEVINKIKNGLEINYVRNEKNLGWGLNFFQCFNLAKGKYVLLLGDDDLIYDGALEIIIKELSSNEDYGVVFIKPYGFNNDFREEYPGKSGIIKAYQDSGEFMFAVKSIMRMISASIINKEVIKEFDTSKITPGNFAHLHMILTALLKSPKNLYIKKYMVATMRNNSSNYNFYEIFVQEYWQLLNSFKSLGLKDSTINKLQNNMLFTYYPYYALMERLANKHDSEKTLQYFGSLKDKKLFRYWLSPIIKWPKLPAVVWGLVTTFIGRAYNGELLRGFVFLQKSIIKSK